VLISRFAVGAKNFVPAMAGAVRMKLFWYELYTVLGAMIYTTLMVTIGWFLGENMDQALKVARNISYVGLVLFLLFVFVAYQAGKRIRERRKVAALLREELEIAEKDNEVL
jgi:membrane protein DedA with SNARE-associated domain